MIGLLVAAGVLGLMVVLPIGGADMLGGHLDAQQAGCRPAAGLALNSTAMIVAGMIVESASARSDQPDG